MSLVAWYRPYEGDTSILDYGKDENPSDLREKKTSDDKTYYSVQNDFDTAFKTIGSLTLSVWINTESTLPETAFGQPGFAGIISIASGRNLGLRMTDSGLVPSYAYYDSTSTLKYLDSSVVINDGEDHWIAITQDQEKISLWVDGEKDAEVVTHINGGFPTGTYIGNSVISLSDDAFENLSDGEWGDLRVYDEALSEDILGGIFEADSFHSDNSSSFYKAATVTIGGNTVADVITHSFIMMDSEGLWRSIDTTHEFSITSPIYFYRGPDKSDTTNPPTCIRDGYLMDKGPVDARKALLGSYASYFEFVGPVYFNTTSNAGNTLKFKNPLCIYSPTTTSVLIGEVLNRDELVFVNIQLGQEEADGRKAFGEYFKGVISGVDNFPKKPWKVGDYLVVSESFSYVGTNFVKGNAYTYNGTGWTIIEANGDNSAKLQELLGILLEAGVDLEDISNANTVSWFNTIVANAIVVGHMTLVITQYGFSTSNTVEPQVWSPTLDLSEDGQYMEATWGDSYITWEDQIIRFVIAEGDFLWTRTSSDNGKTWQVHCVTGEAGASVESITPLYYYTAGAMPSRPTQPVTSTSKAANQWTRVLPDLINNTYKYYTCSEIEFDSTNAGASGFAWSEVIEDTIAEQAGYSYYQFTAADGLFQSIQGQVNSINGSYVQSSINQTTNEISLLVSKSSGATTKTTIGGIKISLDSNGNPYIVLDGDADITGALTTVDVYSRSLRDYASNRGQSISAYTGNKFLPSDLATGYALTDSTGSLQANNAYIQNGTFRNINAEGFRTLEMNKSAWAWGSGVNANWNGTSGDPHFLTLAIMFNYLMNSSDYPNLIAGQPAVYRGQAKIAYDAVGYDFSSSRSGDTSTPIDANDCYLVYNKISFPGASNAEVMTFYKGGHSLAVLYAQLSNGIVDYISYDKEPWRAYSPSSSTYNQFHALVGFSYSQPAIKGLISWRSVDSSDKTPVTIGDSTNPFDFIYGDSILGKKMYSKEIYGEKVYGAVFNR